MALDLLERCHSAGRLILRQADVDISCLNIDKNVNLNYTKWLHFLKQICAIFADREVEQRFKLSALRIAN